MLQNNRISSRDRLRDPSRPCVSSSQPVACVCVCAFLSLYPPVSSERLSFARFFLFASAVRTAKGNVCGQVRLVYEHRGSIRTRQQVEGTIKPFFRVIVVLDFPNLTSLRAHTAPQLKFELLLFLLTRLLIIMTLQPVQSASRYLPSLLFVPFLPKYSVSRSHQRTIGWDFTSGHSTQITSFLLFTFYTRWIGSFGSLFASPLASSTSNDDRQTMMENVLDITHLNGIGLPLFWHDDIDGCLLTLAVQLRRLLQSYRVS